MSDPEMKRQSFEQAARHVAELEERIAAQEAMLATLDRDGHSTEEAQKLLNVFRELLAQARVHEGLTVDSLIRAGKSDPA